MKKFAVFPGSFDPITIGHEDVIRRAAAVFGSCVVLVMNNDQKKYRFSPEQRVALCRAAFRGERKITVQYDAGQLSDWLLAHPGAVLVKGLRSGTDLEYEKPQAAHHRLHAGCETLFLVAKDEFQSVSSTKVRQKMEENGDLSGLLSEKVEKFFRNKL